MKNVKKIQFKLILIGFLFSIGLNAQIYISTNGNDSNTGTIDEPLATLIGARDKARSTGIKTIYIRGGRYNFDTTCNLDGQDSGIIFTGYQDEKVIFDGSEFIDPGQFQLVADGDLSAKLHSNAIGKVYSQVITDVALKEFLNKPTSQISIDNKMATVARFPNNGYAHMNNGTVSGNQVRVEGTDEDPKGALFKLIEPINSSKWNAELSRIKKARVKGYFSADFYKEDLSVNSVSSGGDIRLTDGTRYDIKLGGHPNRLFVYHLLCELDEPGEWYFDSDDSRLYIWPYAPISQDTEIGAWAGPQCFEIKDAQDVQIKKMTIQNVGRGSNGDGAINVTGSSNNVLIAGVTFRYISSPILAVNLWHDVRNCRVLSCDFYDIPNSTRLYGGKMTSTSIEHGNNSIENCHFTQVYSKDFYGKACGMSGAGNAFKNNLIHNMNGQPVTHTGVDHVIELNEAFNVGIEEGDGGAFYTGAALWSFGNKIRHNFVHHIMSVPKLLGRASFFSDDLDSGEEVYENIVYKGGWEALKMNQGGAHSVSRNVVLECYRGIRNGSSKASLYNKVMNYLGTNPTSNDKDNYIGKMLKITGTSGWETNLTADNFTDRVDDFWYQRYPKMKTLFQAYNDNDQFRPYECDYTDNMFYGNTQNVLSGGIEPVQGSQDIGLDIFVNPNALNFKFKEPRPGYAPDIPFENIGLFLDEYRCTVPDKDVYRQKMKQRFDGQASHVNDATYNYDTINDQLYYNSGEMIYKLAPCLGATEEIGDDSYTIKTTGETCPDKNNGQIKIVAKNVGSYVANFNGTADINFTNEWTIEDIAPGTYDLCITNTATSLQQCYSVEIEEGTSVTGKTSIKSNKVTIDITDGTAPFDVLVNGEMVLQTSSKSFSVVANYGDSIEVKTSVACEGALTKTMDGIITSSPNPTDGNFEIELSMPLKVVTVELYNVYSQLISTKSYKVNNRKIQLDINNKPAGIYFAVVQLDKKPKVLKIMKK
ncbi:T9SS type A sorting domain-containing protein [Flavivirga rizhaonensis]|uniref:T9SS type A sorting domain-containing protein n=1 Tax=Flavivirga rizhaonensis TaxID=2559571 RepID=A0A4S1E0K7_9FLAO|nr:T9SS type A sorting domain-containing protein [Flavivirga rizhaonensis]TGV04171.1 T9SS type A sorting domain-containing protein [Flavivirga rizhaonensis]